MSVLNDCVYQHAVLSTKQDCPHIEGNFLRAFSHRFKNFWSCIGNFFASVRDVRENENARRTPYEYVGVRGLLS
jgi:hypothetical protein